MQLFTSSSLSFTVLTRVTSLCVAAELQSHLMNLWNPPLLNRGPRFQDIKGKIIPSRSPKNILMCLYCVVFSHRSLPLSFDCIKSSDEKKNQNYEYRCAGKPRKFTSRQSNKWAPPGKLWERAFSQQPDYQNHCSLVKYSNLTGTSIIIIWQYHNSLSSINYFCNLGHVWGTFPAGWFPVMLLASLYHLRITPSMKDSCAVKIQFQNRNAILHISDFRRSLHPSQF